MPCYVMPCETLAWRVQIRLNCGACQDSCFLSSFDNISFVELTSSSWCMRWQALLSYSLAETGFADGLLKLLCKPYALHGPRPVERARYGRNTHQVLSSQSLYYNAVGTVNVGAQLPSILVVLLSRFSPCLPP